MLQWAQDWRWKTRRVIYPRGKVGHASLCSSSYPKRAEPGQKGLDASGPTGKATWVPRDPKLKWFLGKESVPGPQPFVQDALDLWVNLSSLENKVLMTEIVHYSYHNNGYPISPSWIWTNSTCFMKWGSTLSSSNSGTCTGLHCYWPN